MTVWDTSVASGLHPDRPLFELANEAALAGEPFLLAAPTVHEVAFGLQRQAGEDSRFGAALTWFTELLDVGILGVLPLSWEAALLGGRLRARQPVPPTSGAARPKRSRGPKPERRVAWVTDIHIAATAWLAGEAVCTADQNHFKLLSAVIADLFPSEAKLRVLSPPEPGRR
jgi:predicted nucleic acid-binding protein